MRLFSLVLSAVFLSGPIHPIVAHADEQRCAPKAKALKYLKDTYNEVPVWIGDSKDGYEIIVTQSPKGTWTLINVHGDKNGNTTDDSTSCEMGNDGNSIENSP